ncbi:ras-related and estrogen-regulated growth inhibitor-like protein [Paramormyrops kingsleyae]|uniref:ras-related and estrogen-regulated growth inhibitor-like protein n=1 Tax=Paramormyrops kingsleyae TaxID=1676925 RepID=UPI003B97B66D
MQRCKPQSVSALQQLSLCMCRFSFRSKTRRLVERTHLAVPNTDVWKGDLKGSCKHLKMNPKPAASPLATLQPHTSSSVRQSLIGDRGRELGGVRRGGDLWVALGSVLVQWEGRRKAAGVFFLSAPPAAERFSWAVQTLSLYSPQRVGAAADMNDIKLALLGSEGAGKSAILVRFLTKRFIGEYASNASSLYHKRFSIDGRQLNLEVFDPCSETVQSRCITEEPVEWADGFIVVYDISNRLSFLNAQSTLCQIKEARAENCKCEVEVPVCLVGNKQDLCHARQVSEEEGRSLAQENKCFFQEVSAAEDHQEISNLFTKLIRSVMEYLKHRADRRRYSGSKSMAKLINNVFGKRRKSV